MSQQVSVWTQRQDGSTQVGAMRSSKGLFVKTPDLVPHWTASWNSDVHQHTFFRYHSYHTEHALTAWCVGISGRACMNVYGSMWFSDGSLCLCERLCEQMIIVNIHFLNCFNCFFELCCKSEWLITFWGNDSLTLCVLILKTVNLDVAI